MTANTIDTLFNERQINLYANDDQDESIVRTLADGSYIIVWTSRGQDGNVDGIFAQRFTESGQRLGAEFQVNSTVLGNQATASVTGLAGGGFVVTWVDQFGHDGSSWGIYSQLYDVNGQPVGSEALVNTTTVSSQQEPAVTGLSDGSYVITWRDDSGSDGSVSGVFAQRFDAAGNALGSEFQINTTGANHQFDPAVTALGAGFVVVWTSSLQDGSGNGVFLQRFDDNGNAVGLESQVNLEVASDQGEAQVVELANGGLVVTWASLTSGSAGDGSGAGVFARVFDAAGNPATGEVLVNTITVSGQSQPSIAALSTGGFVIVWTDQSGADGSSWGVFGQEFDGAGNPVGVQFQVNQQSSSIQYQPSVTALQNGGYVVTWSSNASGEAGDGSGYGVFSRTFGDPANFAVQVSPELEGISGEITFNENDLNAGPLLLDMNGASAVSDADSTDFEGGHLVVSRLTGLGFDNQLGFDSSTQEQLGIRNQGVGAGQIGVVGSDVTYEGTVIGSVVSNGVNGTDLVIQFNNNANATSVEALVENLTYQNTSDDPVESRQYAIQVSDGDGGTSIPQIVTVNIVPELDGLPAVGGERQVNSFISGEQASSSLAGLSDGGYVIVWQSDAQDGSGNGIFAQRYTQEGVITGSEVLVNTTVLGSQVDPVVAGLTGGGYVVAWTDQNSGLDGSGWGVFAQQFDTFGNAVGSEFLVNSTTVSSQYEPSIASLSDGGFVIVYRDDSGSDGSAAGVLGQRFNALGNAVGSEFQVNTQFSSSQFDPSITGLSGGGFVVTWTSVSSGLAGDGSSWGTFAQVYDAAGSAVGSEFQVNTTTVQSQYQAVVAGLNGGGFVVAWRDDGGQDGSADAVFAQRYDASGAALGAEFRVNENTSSSQFAPSIAALEDGGFVVAWQDNSGRDGSGNGIFAQQYDAAGNRIDGEFQVNSEFSSTQSDPAITAVNGGGFVVSWTSNTSGSAGDGDNTGIFHQRFGTSVASQAAPVLTEVNATVVFTESSINAAPQLLDVNQSVYVNDVDSADFDGGSLLVTRLTQPAGLLSQFQAPDDESQDQLGIQNQGLGVGQIGVNATNVTFSGITIGTIASDGSQGSALRVDFNANASLEAVEALVESLTYANLSDDPVETRQFRVQIADGDGGTSDPAVVTVHITPDADGVGSVLSERQTNSFTVSNQDNQSVAGLVDGSYVIVWQSDNQDGSGSGIFGQLYTSAGVLSGAEFLINTSVLGNQVEPVVASLAGGGFVVSWTDQNTAADGSSWGVLAQRFDATGNPVGSQFVANTTTSSTQYESSIAGLADGGFVVVYRDDGGSDGSGAGVLGQRFDASGNPVGLEFQANTEFSSSQFDPSVTGLSGGGFVVTWTSVTSGSAGDGSGWGTFAQLYDAAGSAVGGEFQVNTTTAQSQYQAVVAGLTGGGFVVAWRDDGGQDGSVNGVFAQRYDASGAALGFEFRVNENTSSSQFAPTVAALDNGGFVIAWEDNSGRDGSGNGIFAQQYDAMGHRVDGEFQVNTEFSSTQSNPSVTGLNNGNFLIAWTSNSSGTAGDGSGNGVFHQLFGNEADFISQSAPVLEGVNLDVTYYEGDINAAPALLDANGAVALSDLDSANFEGGSVQVSRSTLPVALLDQLQAPDDATQDQLGIRDQGLGAGQIGVSGANVFYEGALIGVVTSNGNNGSDLTIALNASATVVAVEALIENLTYANTSNDPVGSRQYRIQVSDGDGGTSTPALVTVNVLPELDGAESAGLETQVNTETASHQFESSVAELSDGSFVVVWTSETSGSAGDGNGRGVFGQRFDASGNALGSEFQINTQTISDQDEPQVAALSGGGFVVTWADQSGSDGSGIGVYAQRFDNAGVAQGAEFLVNTTISSTQDDPSIVALAGGGFVITWTDHGSADGSGLGIFGQRFDASGNPVGSEFQANTESSSSQFESSVAGLSGGGFVVTWTSVTSGSAGDGSSWGTFARLYDAVGNAVGSEFQVNTNTVGSQYTSVVTGLSGGGFVVAWRDDSGLDGASDGIFAQQYDASGVAVGDEFRVNENTSVSQFAPTIASLSNGGFAIAWQDNSGRDGSGNGIFAQQYDATGQRVDGEFQVNTEFSSTQSDPAIAGISSGGFVITWTSNTSGSAGDGNGTGVFLQRFVSGTATPPLPESDLLAERQVNLFEQGAQDQSDAATLSDGSYILVWSSENQDGNGQAVVGQRFSAAGERMGPEFIVNTSPLGNQTEPAVAALSGGGFVITWTDQLGLDGSGQGVFAQRYDVNGQTVGNEFQVNTEFSSTQTDVDAIGLTDGSFVVVWESVSSGSAGDGNNLGVFGQRFDALGNTLGSEFQVNTEFLGLQGEPSISTLGTGFVVVWTSNDSSSAGIFAQRYDVGGNPLGSEFQINVGANAGQIQPKVVELAGGGFAVVWMSRAGSVGGDGNSDGVFARVYDAAGVAVTGDIQVNTTFINSQFDPAIAALSGGGFAVTWTDASGADGNSWGVFGQEFDASGTAVGSEFQVNQENASTQYQSTVTGLANDTFVVAWSSFTSGTAGDGDDYGVFSRLFGQASDFTVQASPELEGLPSQVTFLEDTLNAAPQLLDTTGAVAVSDADSANFDGGQLIVSRLTDFGSASQFGFDAEQQEQLGIRNQGNNAGEVGVSGAVISYGGVAIGTIDSDGTNGSDLVLTFNANATANAVEAVVENLTYQNTSSDPIPARQYTLQISDGDGATSTPHIMTVNITAETDGVSPVFGERQVNSFITGDQDFPSVAALADGGYVIVWQSSAQDGSSTGVFGQRYSADGVIVGSEFLINSQVLGAQFEPAVTGLTGGGFVVVWTDQNGTDGSSWGVFTQRYDSNGVALGVQTQVNTEFSGVQDEPSITALSDGGYLVTWTSQNSASAGDGSGDGVFAQRFDAGGNALGGEFQINTETSSSQNNPATAALAGGGFVVTWVSNTSGTAGDGDSSGIFAQRFDDTASPVGSEFQINTIISGAQVTPVVAGLDDGSFVIAWTDQNALDGSSWGVYAQRFAADGTALDSQFRVNQTVSSSQHEPTITSLDSGGFVIAWRDDSGADGSANGIFAQQYDAVGNRVDGEFQVNTEFSSAQISPSIAGLPNGNFVVAWQSFTSGTAGDGSSYGIAHQLFGDAADFNPQASPVLAEVNEEVIYLENTVNSTPQLLDLNESVSLSDLDSSDFDGGSLLVTRLTLSEPLLDQFNSPDDSSQDQLGIRNQGSGAGQIGVSGTSVSYQGLAIGTLVSSGANGSALQVDLNANADAQAVEALIENLTYANTSDDPVSSRQYRIQVSDGDGGTSLPQVVTVNITPEMERTPSLLGERQVNSFTLGEQDRPAAAALADGGYVIVWESSEQDGASTGVFGQRYSADGVIVGSEFLVNTQALGAQVEPTVAGLAGGGFVVVWTDQNGTDGSSWGVFAQRYDGNGQMLGSQTQVNTEFSSTQYQPSITALADGGYVVTWTSQTSGSAGDGSGEGIFAQRFDAVGNTVGSEIQVNSQSASQQNLPSVAALTDGGFVVTWVSNTSGAAGDGDGTGIFAQRFDANANPLGGEFQVNSVVSGNQTAPVVAGLTDGTFVVAWVDQNTLDSSSWGVFAQHFSANGTPVGNQFRVNESVSSSQHEPTITALDNGNFVIAWRDDSGRDGSGSGIFAQEYDAVGNRVDGEFQVNTEFSSTQMSPAVTGLPNGNFVIAWQSFSSGGSADGSNYGIFHQLYGQADEFNPQAAPQLEALNSEVTYSESVVNAAPQLLDMNGALAVSDADSTDFDGGNILVARLNSPEALLDQFNTPDDGTQDQLGIRHQGTAPGQVGVSGTSVTFGGIAVGSIVSDGANGSPFEIALNAAADVAIVEALIENLTYANNSDDPIASRQFRVQVSDGDGGTSEPQIVTVNITPTPDAAVPVFGERQANTETLLDQDESVVATLGDGSFVIVWTSRSNGTTADGSLDGVFGQRFDALGNPVGTEFQINTQTSSNQNNAQIAATEGGGFVVVWDSANSAPAGDGSGNAVIVRQFDGLASDGTPTATAGEFVANTSTSSTQENADVSALPGGGFVVVWQSSASAAAGGDGSGFGIIGQRFDETGALTGSEFIVNTETSSTQSQPKVTTLADGGFLVVWTSITSGSAGDGDGQGVFGQRYDATGNAVARDGSALGSGESGEFQINVETTSTQEMPDVTALADGGFVVAWQSSGQDGSGTGIYARQFADNGLPIANEFRVNDERSSNQYNTNVSSLSTGGYVITWQDDSGRDGSSVGVFGQQYDANGNRLDSEFQVNTEFSSWQYQPAVSALADGGFVVSWSSWTSGTAGDGSDYGIFYQLYGNAPPQVTDVTVNGFEDTAIVLNDQLFIEGFDDPDGQGLALIEIAVVPTQGTLLLRGVAVNPGDQITLSELASGDLTYLGNQDFFGADSFGWQGSDGLVFSTEVAQTNVNVVPVNDAPGLEAGADATSTEGQNFARTLNLSDPDPDTYTFTVDFGDGSAPTVFNTANKSPGVNHVYATEGSYTVTVTVDDNSAAANAQETDTFVVTVENGNPVARNDFFGTDEDTSVNGNVLANNGAGADSDPGGDSLSIVAVNGNTADVDSQITLPSGALLTLNSDGTFDYEPNGVFDSLTGTEFGSDDFTYTVSDGEGGTDTATVSINVNGLNDAPIAEDDNVATNENALLNGNVLLNNGNGADEDIDGGVGGLNVVSVNGSAASLGSQVTLASGALLTLNVDGTFTYDPNGQFDGLNAGQTDTDTFTYVIEDEGGLQDGATVNVTINGVDSLNSPPVAENDDFGTDENSAIAGNVFDDNGNGVDFDPDGDALSVQNAGTFATDNGGIININDDGSFNYSPNVAFETLSAGDSDIDTFIYTLSDGNGGTDTAVITFTITGINDAPIAEEDAIVTDEDTAVSGNVLVDNGNGADSDVEGDALTVTEVNGSAAGVGTQITLASGALLTLNADGSFDYNPNGQFESLGVGDTTTDSFAYTISDGNGGTDTATATVTINGVNDAPIAEDDAVATNEDTVVSGNVLADNSNGADSDAEGDALIVTEVNGNAAGVGTQITLASGALLTLNADGSFDYDPNGQFESLGVGDTATDSFAYTVSDGNGGTDTATATITINGVNDAPIAEDDVIATDEDTAVSGNVLADNGNGADSDVEGDALTVTEVNGNAAGVGTQITLASGALLTLNADGSFDYDPNGQFESLGVGDTTTDSFTYTISDGNGGTGTATATVAINGLLDVPDNQSPEALDDAIATVEDVSVSGSVFADNGSGVDNDPDGDSFFVTQVNGNATGVGTQIILASGALLTLNADGSFDYDPNGQFESLGVGDTATDSFAYTISDGNGGTDTATATVTINGINDAPIAEDDAIATGEDTAVSGNVLADNGNGVDSDVEGDALTVTEVNGNAAGIGTQITLASGALLTLNADGSFDYDPSGQFESLGVGDTATDSFTYTISDGNGGTDTATATVTINGVNDAPIAEDDAIATDEDTAVSGNVLADNGNGVDSDVEGDALTVTEVNGNAAGIGTQITLASGALLTLNADGSFDYDPNGQFESLGVGDTATDSFAYTISDGNGGTDTATATVTINGVNDVFPTIELGDAPSRLPRNDRDAWKNAWSDDAVDISHKANVEDSSESWSSVSLSSAQSHLLAGGDVYAGDLGVSGQVIETGVARQEIEGTEALRFELDTLATEANFDFSQLNTEGELREAGRIQALNENGDVVSETLFVADGSSNNQQAQVSADEGFSQIILTSGAYDGNTFVFGALVDEQGNFASGPNETLSQGSDYLVNSAEFVFGAIDNNQAASSLPDETQDSTLPLIGVQDTNEINELG